MPLNKLPRAGIAAAACAVIGATAGIAASAAAPSHHGSGSTTVTSTTTARMPPNGPVQRFAERFPVHSEQVVLNRAGTAYITVTIDDGTVSSVSGNSLSIKEGTASVPYKTVTVTIPSGATIIHDGTKATLSDLKSGEFVVVRSSSDGTFVLAGDRSPRGHWGMRHPPARPHVPGGPHGWPGPGGGPGWGPRWHRGG